MKLNVRLANYSVVPLICLIFIFLNWTGVVTVRLGLLSYLALLAVAGYIISDHFYGLWLAKKISFLLENNHRLFIFYGFIFALTHSVLIWQRYYGLFFQRFLDFSSWPAVFINCWLFSLILMVLLVISDIANRNGWLEEHLPLVWRVLSWLVFLLAFAYCYFMTDTVLEKLAVGLVLFLVLLITFVILVKKKVKPA